MTTLFRKASNLVILTFTKKLFSRVAVIHHSLHRFARDIFLYIFFLAKWTLGHCLMKIM